MVIEIQVPSIVMLAGISGAGKSTFARRMFCRTEILSSDYCRALVSDDENNQRVSPDAFSLLMKIARLRLKNRRLCVIDATNTSPWERGKFVRLANEFGCAVNAIVFRIPMEVCLERMRNRRDRDITEPAVLEQHRALMGHLPCLPLEGFAPIWNLDCELLVPGAIEIRRFDYQREQ
jgi:protein phosphatase